MTKEAATESPADSEEEIPKLPRAPLFGKPSLNGVVRVGMFATLLYAIIVMRRPCAEGVGRFIGGFDEAPDAGPSSITDHYPGYELMTAEEALKRWPDSQLRDGGVSDASDQELPAEGNTPVDERAAEKAPEDKAPEGNTPVDERAADKAPEDKAPEDKAPEDKAPAPSTVP